MRALIVGGGGQLARDLETRLGSQATSFSHRELDVCDRAAVDAVFQRVDPDVVFNCAAFHNVDVCEREPDQAWRVNVEAVRQLAEREVPLVHISTNYVFDGRREAPYAEHDLPSPRSVYAITKLAGEHAALAYSTKALIVRTAGLYGLHGSGSKGGNFVQRMVARARARSTIRMVNDQLLQPTYTADLAGAILDAVQLGVTGVVHLTASESCSWYEFTKAITEFAGLDACLEAVQTTRARGGADRPLNGVLARRRADDLELRPLRAWRDALADYMGAAGLRSPRVDGAPVDTRLECEAP